MPRNPVVARRQLGMELRALRERAEISTRDAAKKIEVSQSTLSRIETGRSAPKRLELEALADYIGASGDELGQLLELAEVGRQPSWYNRYRDILPANSPMHRFVGLEEEASSILSFSNGWIPGLLQTERYARVVYKALTPERSSATVDRLIRFRMERREVIMREDQPATLHAMVDESAIIRLCGGLEVMIEQLEHLIAVCESAGSHVDLQILPLSAGLHGVLQGNSSILLFENSQNPTTVFVEGPGSPVFESQSDEVRRFIDEFRMAEAYTLKGAAAIERIRNVLDGFERKQITIDL